jgi:uncharacterized membrane protein YgdD (TMEM256/DUF423 family)
MTNTKLATLGAVIAGLAVVFGAFGAHSLESASENWPETNRQKRLDNWATAAEYQMYHGLAMLAAAAWLNSVGMARDPANSSVSGRMPNSLARFAGWAFLLGTVLFSGSLYLYTLTGIAKFGAITPLGGVSWIVAWTCLALVLAKPTSP